MNLVGSKNTVWYPHYGAWAIALLAEVILFALDLGSGLPKISFTYARTTVRVLRLLLVVALPLSVLLDMLRSSTATDEESSSLLGHSTLITEEEHAPNGTSKYGSIATEPAEANLEYETQKQKKDEEDRQKLEKVLGDSGNWVKYAFHL